MRDNHNRYDTGDMVAIISIITIVIGVIAIN